MDLIYDNEKHVGKSPYSYKVITTAKKYYNSSPSIPLNLVIVDK